MPGKRYWAVSAIALLMTVAVATADSRQNAAVNGTAAVLAAHGFGGLTGSGISIGLNESGIPNSNGMVTAGSNLPAGNPNLPAAQILVLSGAGNNVRNHASQTAGVVLSTIAGEPGIATGATLAVAHNGDVTTGGGAGGSAGSMNILSIFKRPQTPIINMSWGLTIPNNNGKNYVSPFVDWGVVKYNMLAVVAGNESGGATGSPSDAYNVMNIAASGFRVAGALNYNIVDYNNFNLSNTTSDGRIGTDLVAPGGDPGPTAGTSGPNLAGGLAFDHFFRTTAGGQITNVGATVNTQSDTYNSQEVGFADTSTNSAYFRSAANATVNPTTIAGTSFAAPLVSGAAALLNKQYAILTNTNLNLDHRVAHALLCNGATKVNLQSRNAAGAMNPWTRAGNGVGNRNVTTPSGATGAITVRPGLDPLLGTGQLDVVGSLVNLMAGGNQPGDVPPIGWAAGIVKKDTNNGGTTVPNNITPAANPKPNDPSTYAYGYKFVTGGGLFRATLVWDIPVSITANAGPNDEWQPGTAANPSSTLTDGILADLDLYLFSVVGNAFTHVISSTSALDNLEHLYVANLPAGTYQLAVVDVNAPIDTSYGLAWSVPEPTSLAMLFAAVAMLSRQSRRRRQFA